MLRVIAGEHRGRRLRAPAGLHTRPTADRVRQALFNILPPPPPGSVVLDLYAGSGALGVGVGNEHGEFLGLCAGRRSAEPGTVGGGVAAAGRLPGSGLRTAPC